MISLRPIIDASCSAAAFWQMFGSKSDENGQQVRSHRMAQGILAGRAGLQSPDVSPAAEVDAAFACAVATFGRLDVLFNIAGHFGPSCLIYEISPEEWRASMAVSLDGMFLCGRHPADGQPAARRECDVFDDLGKQDAICGAGFGCCERVSDWSSSAPSCSPDAAAAESGICGDSSRKGKVCCLAIPDSAAAASGLQRTFIMTSDAGLMTVRLTKKDQGVEEASSRDQQIH